MCEPTTIMAGIGLALTAFGTMQQMSAASDARSAAQAEAQFTAAIAKNNEITAMDLADDARDRGEIEVERHELRKRQLIGQQRVVLASGGVLIDEGSAADITADTEAIGQLDKLTIRNNAEREALGFEREGANFAGQGQLAIFRGSVGASAARARGVSSLITGAGTVANKWYTFKKSSGPSSFGPTSSQLAVSRGFSAGGFSSSGPF